MRGFRHDATTKPTLTLPSPFGKGEATNSGQQAWAERAPSKLLRARSEMRIRRRLDSRCKVNRVRESLIAEKEVK